MKVEYKYNSGVLKLSFYPEKGECEDSTQKLKMGTSVCTTFLPKDWKIESLHPDILGLVTILIVFPYTKSQIILPKAVSQIFHNEVKKATGISILPVNAALKARKASSHFIPALAYSGGIDSTACLTIMPSNTCSVFHDRTYNKEDVYNNSAARHACKLLQQSGREIYMIKSDFDKVRSPNGFAVEMSTAIPALLLSDYIGFDGIAVGTTLEYFIDYSRYYEKRTYSIAWENLFQAVQVNLIQPTAGISEVGNYKIVLNSPYSQFAESCMSGSVGKPCMKCFKCFRKQLLKMALQKKAVSNEMLNDFFSIRGVRNKLEKFPIFFENVITYITANYHGNHQLMNMLKKKTRGDVTDVSWMEKWYSSSLKIIPVQYQAEIRKNIKKHLNVMTVEDEKTIKQWQSDFNQVLTSPEIKKFHSKFVHTVRKQYNK
ncbi:MAG: DUF6395 domain-containing protein [Bacillota bacterium]